MAGGTGFYIHALAYGAEFEEETKSKVREQLEKRSDEDLYAYLQQVDPASCETIHMNNRKRVIRALEYYEQTGNRMSELNARLKEKEAVYDLCFLVLDLDRTVLYERIDRRVDIMLEQGLVDEVRRLRDAGYHREMVSMKGLGYKEILAYLDGEISLEEAVYVLKRDTRHFAKRQLTWMRREKDVTFLEREPVETLVDRAEKVVTERFGL